MTQFDRIPGIVRHDSTEGSLVDEGSESEYSRSVSRRSSRSRSRKHVSGRSSHHKKVIESNPITDGRPNPVRQLHRVEPSQPSSLPFSRQLAEVSSPSYFDSRQYQSDTRLYQARPLSQTLQSNDLIGDYSGSRTVFQQPQPSVLQPASRKFDLPKSDIDDVISRVLQKTFN